MSSTDNSELTAGQVPGTVVPVTDLQAPTEPVPEEYLEFVDPEDDVIPEMPKPEPAPPVSKTVKAGADRRPRGWLELDIKSVCNKFVTGEVKLAEGVFLTPYHCAKLVKELDELDEAPSTGAVAAVFDRWEEIGFAEFHEKPRAFKDYTEEGRTLGLEKMKAIRAEERKQAKKK